MYKIIDTINRYPHVVLQLVEITTGDKRYWFFSTLHADDLCKQYHVKSLRGVLLDSLPKDGGWIIKSAINLI